jgi:hypothetical protein
MASLPAAHIVAVIAALEKRDGGRGVPTLQRDQQRLGFWAAEVGELPPLPLGEGWGEGKSRRLDARGASQHGIWRPLPQFDRLVLCPLAARQALKAHILRKRWP